MKNKIIMLGTAICILAVVVYAVMTDGERRKDPEKNTSPQNGDVTETAPEPRTMGQSTDQALLAFPPGFPGGAEIENGTSFKYIPANSLEQQSTIEYVSSKSFAENQSAFKEYLESAGFQITNTTEESSMAFYYATKDNNDLSVSIQELNGEVGISASYLRR